LIGETIRTVSFFSAFTMGIDEAEARESERENRNLTEETFIDNDRRRLKRRAAEFERRDSHLA
jgi:hypothetical protein